MEAHHHEAPGRLEDALGGGERGQELVELFIDEHAQRLERAGCRMDRAGTCVHDPRDELGERPRRFDRRGLAGGNDGARDGARLPLLAKLENDIGQVALRPAPPRRPRSVPRRPCAYRAARPSGMKTRAPPRRAASRTRRDRAPRRRPRRGAELMRDPLDLREARLHQREPATRRLHETGAERHRGLVAVERDDARCGRRRGWRCCSRRPRMCRRCRDRRRAAATGRERHGRAPECGGPIRQRKRAAAARHDRAPNGPRAGEPGRRGAKTS